VVFVLVRFFRKKFGSGFVLCGNQMAAKTKIE